MYIVHKPWTWTGHSQIHWLQKLRLLCFKSSHDERKNGPWWCHSKPKNFLLYLHPPKPMWQLQATEPSHLTPAIVLWKLPTSGFVIASWCSICQGQTTEQHFGEGPVRPRCVSKSGLEPPHQPNPMRGTWGLTGLRPKNGLNDSGLIAFHIASTWLHRWSVFLGGRMSLHQTHPRPVWKFARPLTTFWSQGRPIHRSENPLWHSVPEISTQTSKNSRYFTQRILPIRCLWWFQITWRVNRIQENLGTKPQAPHQHARAMASKPKARHGQVTWDCNWNGHLHSKGWKLRKKDQKTKNKIHCADLKAFPIDSVFFDDRLSAQIFSAN